MLPLIAAAWAAPEGAVAAVVSLEVGRPSNEDAAQVGVGGRLVGSVRAVGPLWVELEVGGGALTGLGRFAAGPGLRVDFRRREAGGAVPSLAVGGGVAWRETEGVRPLARVGLSVDLPAAPRWQVRFEASYSAEAWPVGLVGLGVGVRHGGRKEPEPVVVVPEPEPEPVVEEATVWLPYPACGWVTEEAANSFFTRLGAVAARRPVAEVGVDVAAAPTVRGEDGGGLVLVAWPGDVVRVGDELMPVGADGILALAATDVVVVEVTGGGRRQSVTVAAAEGAAVWRRVEAPPAVRVGFASNSAVVSEEARRGLTTLVADAGAWSWRIAGQASPDGDPVRNAALAQRRAEAVAAVMVAAGLPAVRVTIGPALPSDPTLPPEGQRAVVLQPVPLGGGEVSP